MTLVRHFWRHPGQTSARGCLQNKYDAEFDEVIQIEADVWSQIDDFLNWAPQCWFNQPDVYGRLQRRPGRIRLRLDDKRSEPAESRACCPSDRSVGILRARERGRWVKGEERESNPSPERAARQDRLGGNEKTISDFRGLVYRVDLFWTFRTLSCSKLDTVLHYITFQQNIILLYFFIFLFLFSLFLLIVYNVHLKVIYS